MQNPNAEDLSDLFKQCQSKAVNKVIPLVRWQLIFGTTGVLVKKAPNWFHRFMQRLVFGFRWRRL
jgi:hypothetical protein